VVCLPSNFEALSSNPSATKKKKKPKIKKTASNTFSQVWLSPVIQATQEAEIRRIVVQSQPGQIV
jgi:hypothetical protein